MVPEPLAPAPDKGKRYSGIVDPESMYSWGSSEWQALLNCELLGADSR